MTVGVLMTGDDRADPKQVQRILGELGGQVILDIPAKVAIRRGQWPDMLMLPTGERRSKWLDAGWEVTCRRTVKKWDGCRYVLVDLAGEDEQVDMQRQVAGTGGDR